MSKQRKVVEDENTDTSWRGIYTIGGIAALITLLMIMFDIGIGSTTGGDLSALPQTAVDRFAQLQTNPLLGLYNLDLLNMISQMAAIPVFFALYAAHRKRQGGYAMLALLVFLIGTTVFITTNTALPMFELANKYAAATTESQRNLLAAAGEALLVRGTHGSLGVFIGFMLPTIASLAMSLVMLIGEVFNKITSYVGIVGNFLMLIYISLVTFEPSVKIMAIAFAMPGGLLLLAWNVMYMIKLFQLGRMKK